MTYDILKHIGDAGREAFQELAEVDRILFTAVCGILARLPGFIDAEVDFGQLAVAIAKGTSESGAGASLSAIAASVIGEIIVSKDRVFTGNPWFKDLAVSLLSIVHSLHVA